MRLATWNCCCGPLERKLAALNRLAADVAVIPESPKLSAATPHALWYGQNPRKGIAILAQSNFSLRPLRLRTRLPRYVIPIQVEGPRSFLLLAIWAMPGGADPYVRGVVRAIDRCRSLIAAQPTVLLGDFNSNVFWDSKYPRDRNHSALVARLDGLGLVSAYHAFYAEGQGSETRPTFFEYRHENRPYHIDYCFLPAAWCGGLTRVLVGAYPDWRPLSDHMPLAVDFE